jgi:hypothetical protein
LATSKRNLRFSFNPQQPIAILAPFFEIIC